MARIREIESTNKKQVKENENLKAALEKANSRCQKEVLKNARLQASTAARLIKVKRFQAAKMTKAKARAIVHEALSPYLHKDQVDWFLSKEKVNKKAKQWSKPVITIALTILNLSKRTYKYLRQKKLLPLPGISTLKAHFKGFVVEEGHLDHVHQLLTLMALNMSPRDRIVCLSFDEVSVKADLSYDATHDRFIGPKSEANVMMCRGIFSNFKIPIYFVFDTAINKENLEVAIKAVETAGFHVVAVCCDMGTNNTAVKHELKVTVEEPWFKHPCVEERPNSFIYFLHDMPHLLKLLRNHLLSQGFVLKSGVSFGKKELEKLFEKLLSSDLNPAPKLSPAHIHVSGQDKQKVFLATQLLSQTTANCLSSFFPNDDTMQAMSNFFSDVNNVFDIFNSKTEIHPSNLLGNAYGLNLEEQDAVLDRFYDTINNLRAVWDNKKGCKTSHQPWQLGMLQCINALRPLYQELKRDYADINCLFTYKINQDCLEQCFSIIRGMGHMYREFGALEFIRRIRNYILGAGGDVTIEAANVEATEKNDFKIESLIDKDLEVQVSANTSIELNIEKKDAPQNISDDVDVQIADPEDEMEIEAQLDESQQAGLEELVKEIDVFNVSGWVNENARDVQGITKETIISDFKTMEKHFQSMHSVAKDGLLRTKDVTKSLVSKIQLLFPLYPEKIIKKFVLQRSMQRMKFIYRTTIKHKKTSRATMKVTDFVHSKPANELKKPKKKPVKRLKKVTEVKKKAASKKGQKQPIKKQPLRKAKK